MSARSLTAGRDRFASQALRLKKAWLLAAAWVGQSLRPRLGARELTIPDYSSWTRKELQQHVDDLLGDFVSIVRHTTAVETRSQQDRAAAWMAMQFDRWQESGGGLFTMCTAQQFEVEVGRLRVRAQMDIPPYTELLVQGWQGLAFRHPEYMLSRDLQVLCNLSCDAEDLLRSVDWNRAPKWATYASENAQSLNRATIQTCFNLLETFTSGLARSFVMEKPRLGDDQRKKLLDNAKPLRTRVVSVPQLITKNSCDLDTNKPPVSELFGAIKQRRDAIVHCEPGQQESHRGYIKESAFHDVPWTLVQEAIALTTQIIERVWKALHGKDRPTWLPKLGKDGRFARENLRLNPVFPQLGTIQK